MLHLEGDRGGQHWVAGEEREWVGGETNSLGRLGSSNEECVDGM